MQFPTAPLEGKKLSRVIFSIRTSALPDRGISDLLRKLYEMGVWCFDLPSLKHLESFRELRRLTDDDALIGFCHLAVEEGVSFVGKPLHRFESKVISTIKKNLGSSGFFRNLPHTPSSSDVFTQKEIDRISVDPLRLDKAISVFSPQDSPFLVIGNRYGDWLLALGRIDLLKDMVLRVREKGFIPIFSGQWTTFALPKVKALDFAAYAVPVNKGGEFVDLDRACDLVKRFDKPVISLNPLADGGLLKDPEEAFSFLFKELKIHAAIVEIASEVEAGAIIESLKEVPSLIFHRKKGSPPRQRES